MPRPPRIDPLDKVNFIVNYFFQGCTPDFWLFIETAAPASKRLLLLLLLPDLSDIVQSIIGPGSPRRHRPGRHGRKKRLPNAPSFDTSEMIGQKVRGVVNPYDAFDIGPNRYLFKVLNFYEGIAFSAAVLEGVTDVAFEGLLGIVEHNPNDCPNMGYLQRHALNIGILAIVGGWQALNMGHLDGANRFNTMSPFSTSTATGRSQAALTVTCNSDNFGATGVEVALLGAGGVVKGTSGPRDMPLGDSAILTCSGEFDPGEPIAWVGRCTTGTVAVPEANVFAFTGDWF